MTQVPQGPLQNHLEMKRSEDEALYQKILGVSNLSKISQKHLAPYSCAKSDSLTN